jgi:hypothetical protein
MLVFETSIVDSLSFHNWKIWNELTDHRLTFSWGVSNGYMIRRHKEGQLRDVSRVFVGMSSTLINSQNPLVTGLFQVLFPGFLQLMGNC